MADTPDFIPDDQFVPDDASQTTPQGQQPPQQAAPDFVSDQDFQEDPQPQAAAPQTKAQQSAPDFVPDDQFQADDEHYTTPEQKVLTGIEGVGRGATFGLSDALAVGMRKAASALGVPDEDLHYIAPDTQSIAGRKNTNNYLSGGSELAGNLVAMHALPVIGSKAVSTAIQMAAMAGGDEISKAMLGNGDPTSAVAAHIAGNVAAGLVGGKIFGAIGDAIGPKIENLKIGNMMKSFMTGAGHYAALPGSDVVPLVNSALLPEETAQVHDGAFKLGQRFMQNIGSIGTGLTVGHFSSIPGSTLLAGTAEKLLQKYLSPYVQNYSTEYVGLPILKAASTGSINDYSKIIDHSQAIQKGARLIGGSVESIFKSGGNKVNEILASPKEREKLKEYMDNGGIDTSIQDAQQEQQQAAQPQGFAEGGEVDLGLNPGEEDPIAKVWPEQNTMIATAKGRVSNYLNSVRPQTIKNKLPYDTDRPDKQKDREYDKALGLAARPLSIINHIKDGTLLPKHMQAFTSMYPELHGELSKKIQERMAKGQLKGETKPTHQVRQALSLFLGASLDSSLTPQNMAAVQNMYAQAKAQKQPPPSSSSSLSNLGKSAQTPDQARDARFNKS